MLNYAKHFALQRYIGGSIMSKAKFAAAKELIDEKKYDEARAILKTIDHPAARDWETRLDKIAPPVSYKPPEPDWSQPAPPTPVVKTAKPKQATPAQLRGCLV